MFAKIGLGDVRVLVANIDGAVYILHRRCSIPVSSRCDHRDELYVTCVLINGYSPMANIGPVSLKHSTPMQVAERETADTPWTPHQLVANDMSEKRPTGSTIAGPGIRRPLWLGWGRRHAARPEPRHSDGHVGLAQFIPEAIGFDVRAPTAAELAGGRGGMCSCGRAMPTGKSERTVRADGRKMTIPSGRPSPSSPK